MGVEIKATGDSKLMTVSAATIHRCTGESWHFLPWYEYRFSDNIFPNIMILWYFMKKKIRHSEITIFYDSLPKPKPFVKQRDPCMQGKEVPLYCFVCFRSPIFQDGSTKICAVPISCQLTQSCATADKTHGLSVFHSISSQDCLKMSSRKNWHRSRTGSHCH